MQKTTPPPPPTPLLGPYGYHLLGQRQHQLVVATISPDGIVDTSSVQPLSQWNAGARDTTLIARAHGGQLVDILSNELGLVDVDEEGLLRARIVITPDPNVSVMRLLGKIAEAVVVKRCGEDVFRNRKWGAVARRGNDLGVELDDFIAVGTGLKSTSRLYATKANWSDPQRDVIWINKNNKVEQLLQLSTGVPNGISGVHAGIQIKVSQDGMRYIYRSDVARGKYEVPLVYFDLSGDYYTLTNAIYAEDKDVKIGIDIVRGRDIDPECHDLLVSYYWLVLDIVMGRMTLDQVMRHSLLVDSFTKEVQEQSGKGTLTV